MTNRYDKIPDHKVIKSAIQQELTDKQIEYVESAIKRATLRTQHRVYINLDSFNPNQKIKLEQVLKSKGYQLVGKSNWSILIDL